MPSACRSPRPHVYLALLLAVALPLLAEETPPPAQETPARPPLDERSQVEARALGRQLAQREQQMLDAGGDQFLALWLPANASEPSGAVILLPGDDESADWPQSIGPLRRKLPNAGWHSLSLTLPDPKGDLPPIRTASDEVPPSSGDAAVPPAEETPAPSTEEATAAMPVAPEEAALADTETQRDAHAQRVLARIAAGITFAEQRQAKTIVLLGHGTGAYWAARYLAEHKPDGVQNLLLIAAQRPTGFAPELDELIPGLQLATGDVYYQDQAGDRRAALLRQQAGKRQKHPAYTQIAMKARPDNTEIGQEQLYRRIRGWLDTHLQRSGQAAAQPAGG